MPALSGLARRRRRHPWRAAHARRTEHRGAEQRSSSACRPALRATRKSGPSRSRRRPMTRGELDHDIGLAGEARQGLLELAEHAELAARWRRGEAQRLAATPRGLAAPPRPCGPPPQWARSARPAARSEHVLSRPCGRPCRGRARSSPARSRRRAASSALPKITISTEPSRSSRVANIIGSPFLV